MHYLSRSVGVRIQTFDLHLTLVRFFFSAVTLRHMLSPTYILLLSSIILVSLLRTFWSKWVYEWIFLSFFLLLPLMSVDYRNLPFTDDTYRLKIEVCFCLLYLISFEHFKTTDSFLLDTIIYVQENRMTNSILSSLKKSWEKNRKGNHNPIERQKKTREQ